MHTIHILAKYIDRFIRIGFTDKTIASQCVFTKKFVCVCIGVCDDVMMMMIDFFFSISNEFRS